jgi:uncharacterized protein
MALRREEILARLARLRPELAQLGIKSVAVFGSVARDEAIASSDLDLLVEFERTPGIFGVLEAQERLEGLLCCRVDLVTKGSLHPRLKDRILAEAVYA